MTDTYKSSAIVAVVKQGPNSKWIFFYVNMNLKVAITAIIWQSNVILTTLYFLCFLSIFFAISILLKIKLYNYKLFLAILKDLNIINLTNVTLTQF